MLQMISLIFEYLAHLPSISIEKIIFCHSLN